MSRELSSADAKFILWGSLGAGIAITSGAILAATFAEPAADRLMTFAVPYGFGMGVLSLIFWALRASRAGESTRTTIAPRLVQAAYGLCHFAFLFAALLLLIAGLTAWLTGAAPAAPFLRASVLTLLLFTAVRLTSDCLLSLYFLVRIEVSAP